ncbi:MAG: hypothetical protein AAFQ02_01885 [Bacteroidota bacterium]
MTRAKAFSLFLKHFTTEKLPLVLSDENVTYFSTNNTPLAAASIRQFIPPEKDAEDDEFTEYIPCCLIPDTGSMHAVVYWRGSLMSYDYILVTYDKNGTLIDKKIVAGTRAEGDVVMRSIATIEEDWSINIVVGTQHSDDRLYDPQTSENMSLELLPNGEIIFALQEEAE